MPSARTFLIPLLVAASAVGASAVGVRVFMSRTSQDQVSPEEFADIATLRPPLPPPSFLACPPHYCAARPGTNVPIFALPWHQLRDNWTKVIARQPHVVEINARPDGRQINYVQHSSLFRFPDIITVEFIPVGPDRSSLAIYSRSRYGRYDFGQNRRRIDAWLSDLEKQTAFETSVSGRSD